MLKHLYDGLAILFMCLPDDVELRIYDDQVCVGRNLSCFGLMWEETLMRMPGWSFNGSDKRWEFNIE